MIIRARKVVLLASCVALVNAHAAEECIPPAQLKATQDQRNAALDQVAAIVAQATAQIEKLTKELETARKTPETPPKK